jgi:AraC-like DNA-binding protein
MALPLLSNRPYSVTEVSIQIGYADVAHLTVPLKELAVCRQIHTGKSANDN